MPVSCVLKICEKKSEIWFVLWKWRLHFQHRWEKNSCWKKFMLWRIWNILSVGVYIGVNNGSHLWNNHMDIIKTFGYISSLPLLSCSDIHCLFPQYISLHIFKGKGHDTAYPTLYDLAQPFIPGSSLYDQTSLMVFLVIVSKGMVWIVRTASGLSLLPSNKTRKYWLTFSFLFIS